MPLQTTIERIEAIEKYQDHHLPISEKLVPMQLTLLGNLERYAATVDIQVLWRVCMSRATTSQLRWKILITSSLSLSALCRSKSLSASRLLSGFEKNHVVVACMGGRRERERRGGIGRAWGGPLFSGFRPNTDVPDRENPIWECCLGQISPWRPPAASIPPAMLEEPCQMGKCTRIFTGNNHA